MQNVTVLLNHGFYMFNSFAIPYTLTGNVITVYWAQNTSLETILPFFFNEDINECGKCLKLIGSSQRDWNGKRK